MSLTFVCVSCPVYFVNATWGIGQNRKTVFYAFFIRIRFRSSEIMWFFFKLSNSKKTLFECYSCVVHCKWLIIIGTCMIYVCTWNSWCTQIHKEQMIWALPSVLASVEFADKFGHTWQLSVQQFQDPMQSMVNHWKGNTAAVLHFGMIFMDQLSRLS